MTRAGDKLHLMFFVRESRTFGRFLGQLAGQIQAIEDKSQKSWAVSVVVCTDDANTAEKEFAILDQRYPPKLSVGVSVNGELLKASGDKAALQTMIDQWLKMDKLTPEEARSLTAPLPKKADKKPANR